MSTTPQISRPYWNGRGRRRNRVRDVSGIPNSYSYSKPGPARIDATIARLIALLNDAGIVTEYCCSGRPCDHAHDPEIEAWRLAYIKAQRPLPHRFTRILPPGIYVDDLGMSLRFRETTPHGLAGRWRALEAMVRFYASLPEL